MQQRSFAVLDDFFLSVLMRPPRILAVVLVHGITPRVHHGLVMVIVVVLFLLLFESIRFEEWIMAVIVVEAGFATVVVGAVANAGAGAAAVAGVGAAESGGIAVGGAGATTAAGAAAVGGTRATARPRATAAAGAAAVGGARATARPRSTAAARAKVVAVAGFGALAVTLAWGRSVSEILGCVIALAGSSHGADQ